jgi:CRISPR-associated endoribonuclease Cas6
MRPGQFIPVARYRLVFRALDDMPLPEYCGSLLRGQFGDALRCTVCVTGAKTCPPCALYRACAYPSIFETPAPAEHGLQRFSAVPNPYVIEPPPLGTRHVAAGESLSFGLVLVGRALQQLQLIVFAFERALQRGIGERRARAELQDVRHEAEGGGEQAIWDSATQRILPHVAAITVPTLHAARAATLHISTPLRLQNQGRPLRPDELGPRTLLTALMRRASLLLEMHADMGDAVANPSALARQAESLQDSRALQWRDWTRYSSRQRQEMILGGVVGEWHISGNLGDLAHWLWLGQWLHAGKNATMGMGRYHVTFST